ncbi:MULTISPECIES: hypothetical protein [Rhodococcus]|jgi:hypothetical protein|uniref:Uncharacterized protein n=1 Tax=Rhodococcus oxybenzonivorans TaxID=1990687 RepID=A0AAE5A9E0_9NOCA|nr:MULTISPECIES: hypothetical protein [Rhodococcus]MDV7240688.1 hypothetical protein [Rhodococcus oxybenzonivorans]MDV7267729.1 hypothetical protein [Rhodococcus oxybenzonivorans]MDV7272961.1 hypothetical protein [Rhodococcus oxybenzonivorans]MDV7333300.1 hypothetical protein [Rhodococcus oxybenzonivorans]MDV7342467.1 hypothetical protein [Rhodococcus oxybenzonivorans]
MTPHTDSRKKPEFSVGTRVKTRHSVDPELPEKEWPLETGVIVDEFGGVQDITDESYGRNWAVSRRWAIALDGGPLVFRNDPDLEPE